MPHHKFVEVEHYSQLVEHLNSFESELIFGVKKQRPPATVYYHPEKWNWGDRKDAVVGFIKHKAQGDKYYISA